MVGKKSSVLIFLLFLCSFCGMTKGKEVPQAPTISGPSHFKIVICGHLYGLYVKSHEDGTICSEHIIENYVEKLKDIDPAAIFFLGDTTTQSKETEWEMLEKYLLPLRNKCYFLPGNHDKVNTNVFQKHGGTFNESTIIKNNKFILLDAVNIFDTKDLDFIKSEVSDYQKYDNVFILMHYKLFQYKMEAEAGIDATKPYSGISNWNTDVVPILRGKVKYVFCGDYMGINHINVVKDKENEIYYILNSFAFRGEGPAMFLVLVFNGKNFSIIPELIPIDVFDDWWRW